MNIKRDRFEKVASKRVQNILYSLESLAKCSNKNNYEYGDEDIKKMFSAIKAKLKEVESIYSSKIANKNKFKF